MTEIDYRSAFDLVSRIVQNGEGEDFLTEISALSKIINETLPKAVEDNAPSNFPELYSNFKYTFEQFTDFIMFDKLIGKNIVALGGAFSSGKSSFLNSLMGSNMLPAEIDPSTSVPTYIINGTDDKASGINVFNKKVELKIEEVKIISHGYSTEHNVKFGHLIESIFIETPRSAYKSIAFLDTPGYSKPDSDKYSKRTDENIARTQLNSSNFILWFVSVEEGTISEEDIKFIQTLDSGIPFAVIVNKCDKKTESDVKMITKGIKSTLEGKGLFPVAVIPYSCRKPKQFGLEEVVALIEKWNRSDYQSTFARDFKILFIRCIEYFDDMLRNENRRLNWINTGMTFSDIPEVNESFRSLSSEIKITAQKFREKSKLIKDIIKEFFTEIKKVGDKYGILLPEPSEIELISNNTSNLLKIVREIKEKNKIKSDGNYHSLMTILKDKKIELDKGLGHNEYTKGLANEFKVLLKHESSKLHLQLGADKYPSTLVDLIKAKGEIKPIKTKKELITDKLEKETKELLKLSIKAKIDAIKYYFIK